MRTMTSIVFFGTPDFAVPALEALVAAGRRPALVVSQPSRPAGRGQKLAPPAVARRAGELGLPLEQVPSVKDPEFLGRLRALAPDFAIVVAFGQIFPRALLEIPTAGCINLHASLLPRWRGAAPIAAAIAAGDPTTGVCSMKMEAGLDTGPVYLCREVAIGESETAGELATRLAALGATVLDETIERLERGELVARPQPESGVTYAPRLTKDDARLDIAQEAAIVARRMRAVTPAPGAWTTIGGEAIRILAAHRDASRTDEAPGSILGSRGEALAIACGAGSILLVDRAQRPGRRPVTGRELAAGLRIAAGDRVA